MTASVVYNNS